MQRPTFLQTLMAVLDPSRGTVNTLRARLAEAEADLDREKRAHGLTQVDAARFAGRADRAEARAETAEADRDTLTEALREAWRDIAAVSLAHRTRREDVASRAIQKIEAALAAVKGREDVQPARSPRRGAGGRMSDAHEFVVQALTAEIADLRDALARVERERDYWKARADAAETHEHELENAVAEMSVEEDRVAAVLAEVVAARDALRAQVKALMRHIHVSLHRAVVPMSDCRMCAALAAARDADCARKEEE